MPTALPQGAMRQPLAEGLLNDVASGKLSSDAFANRKLITIAVSSRMTQSPNRIRYFGAARSAVENLPRAQHFPDRGLPQFRSAGVDSLSQSRKQPRMAAQPLLCGVSRLAPGSARAGRPGGAIENDDLIGCGFDGGDTLALPVHPNTVRAFRFHGHCLSATPRGPVGRLRRLGRGSRGPTLDSAW